MTDSKDAIYFRSTNFTSRDSWMAPIMTDLLPPGEIFFRATNDSDILDSVKGIVSGLNPTWRTLQPVLAVIFTWHGLYWRGSEVSLGVTHSKRSAGLMQC